MTSGNVMAVCGRERGGKSLRLPLEVSLIVSPRYELLQTELHHVRVPENRGIVILRDSDPAPLQDPLDAHKRLGQLARRQRHVRRLRAGICSSEND